MLQALRGSPESRQYTESNGSSSRERTPSETASHSLTTNTGWMSPEAKTPGDTTAAALYSTAEAWTLPPDAKDDPQREHAGDGLSVEGTDYAGEWRTKRSHKSVSVAGATLGALLLMAAALKVWELPSEGTPQEPPKSPVFPIFPLPKSDNKQRRVKPKLRLPLTSPASMGLLPEPTESPRVKGQSLIKLPVDSESMERYEKEFSSAVQQLEQTWRASPPRILEAFVNHFLPRVDGLVPPAPLALFHRHAEALRGTARPAEADCVSQKTSYAMQLRLVTSIHTIAAQRLAALTELQAFCSTTGIGSKTVGQEATKLPSREKLKAQRHDLVGFSDFVKLLGSRYTADLAAASDQGKQVPRVLAQRLANVLYGDDLQIKQDQEYRDAFDYLVEGALSLTVDSQQSPSLTISPGRRPFNMNAFNKLLVEFESWRVDQFETPETVASWANNWTVDGILDALQKMEEKDARRLEEKATFKVNAAALVANNEGKSTAVPAHDLYGLAVALL